MAYLFHLALMSSKVIHVVINDWSFPFTTELYYIVNTKYATFSLSIHLMIETYCFLILAIVNNVELYRSQIFVQHTDFTSFGYKYMNKISGSYGGSMFSFMRNPHTIFHNGYINLVGYF